MRNQGSTAESAGPPQTSPVSDARQVESGIEERRTFSPRSTPHAKFSRNKMNRPTAKQMLNPRHSPYQRSRGILQTYGNIENQANVEDFDRHTQQLIPHGDEAEVPNLTESGQPHRLYARPHQRRPNSNPLRTTEACRGSPKMNPANEPSTNPTHNHHDAGPFGEVVSRSEQNIPLQNEFICPAKRCRQSPRATEDLEIHRCD